MVVFLRDGGGERTRPPVQRPTPTGLATFRPPTARRPVVAVGPPPGDERGFVHKRLFGAVKGFVSGGPLGAVGGFLSRTRPPVPTVVPQRQGGLAGVVGRGRQLVVRADVVPRSLIPTSAVGCPAGFVSILGRCIPTSPISAISDPTAIGAAQAQDFDGRAAFVGDPVMGRYGAGFEPDVFSTTTRRCGRGAVLGLDGICYNRRDLRNSERFWPRGRRPLLTGGEMRCISVASSAAKKLQKKQKQLTELGLLKRPAPRARRAEPVHVRTAAVAHN